MEAQQRGLLCCRRGRPGAPPEPSARCVDAWRRFVRVQLRIARLRRIWAFLGHHLDAIRMLGGRPSAAQRKAAKRASQGQGAAAPGGR